MRHGNALTVALFLEPMSSLMKPVNIAVLV